MTFPLKSKTKEIVLTRFNNVCLCGCVFVTAVHLDGNAHDKKFQIARSVFAWGRAITNPHIDRYRFGTLHGFHHVSDRSR